MTENIRPYFLFSLGFHLCLILLLLLVKGPRAAEVVPRRVVIEFSQSRERTLPAVVPEQTRLPDLAPQELAESLKMQGPRTLAIPGTKSTVVSPQPKLSIGGERLTYATAEKPLLPQPSSPAAAPRLPAQLPVKELATPPALTQAEESGFTEAGALEWRGRERKVLRAVRPEFPEVLRQEGLGVDVEASFTVAPNGQVTEVDITRSSGYASVDRAVVRALKNYLFEPSDIGQDDVGVQRFSYRLERSN